MIKLSSPARLPRRQRLAAALAVAAVLAVVPVARAADEPAPQTPYPGRTWSPPKATYGWSMDTDVEVRMDDGVRLKVDIVYPTDPTTGERAAGPFPVLLNQDMYAGRPERIPQPPASYGSFFVERGYIFVHVHDRGTGGSEGRFDPGFGDRVGLDGVEMAYWVADPANVPGSNGRVGLQGCSALGVVQLTTLASLGRLLEQGGRVHVPGPTPDDPGRTVAVTDETNPVKAAFPECVGTSVFHEQYTDNGVPSFINLLSLAQPAAQGVMIGYNTQDPSGNVAQSMNTIDMLTGGDTGFYRDYWKERDFVRRAPQIARTGAAVITWVGWQEGGSIGSQPLYAALQNVSAGREAHAPMLPACTGRTRPPACQRISPKYHTLVGDWAHADGSDKGIELQWFETWVMEQDTGLERADQPIHLKEKPSASSDRWINAATYPMTQDYTALHLDGEALSAAAPAASGTRQLAWPAGPPLTYTVSKGYDVDKTILGPASARLWISSSNTNAHLFVQLVDVSDGSSTPITHGSILASRRRTAPSHREGDRHVDPLDPWSWSARNGLPTAPYLTLEHDEPLTPDTAVQLDVPLQPTAWKLLKGHQLQLKIAAYPVETCLARQDPLYSPPVGCAFSAPTAQSLAGGVYQVLHGGERASVVNVPILDSDAVLTATSAPTPTSDDGATLPNDWGSGGSRP